MFLRIRRIFTAAVCLSLCGLFILPGLFLYNNKGRELHALGASLDEALLREDKEKATELLEAMEAVFYPMETRAEAFLQHETVDACTLPLSLLRVRLENNALPEARESLKEFLLSLEHIVSIEVFDWRMFL